MDRREGQAITTCPIRIEAGGVGRCAYRDPGALDTRTVIDHRSNNDLDSWIDFTIPLAGAAYDYTTTFGFCCGQR